MYAPKGNPLHNPNPAFAEFCQPLVAWPLTQGFHVPDEPCGYLARKSHERNSKQQTENYDNKFLVHIALTISVRRAGHLGNDKRPGATRRRLHAVVVCWLHQCSEQLIRLSLLLLSKCNSRKTSSQASRERLPKL